MKLKYLEGVGDGIVENQSPHGVTAVKRIEVRRDDNCIPTNTLILTFNKPTQQTITVGYLKMSKPIGCFTCQRFGQGQTPCHLSMSVVTFVPNP